MSVETTDLRPGHRISRILKGGWQLAGDHGEVQPAQAIADMEAFLDAGITTFDCADIYKGVEEMIGTFIADVRNRRGSEVADRVVVHTKLVPDLGRLTDIRPEEIEAIVDRSLTRLRIERLPLVQFYWWDMALGNAVEALVGAVYLEKGYAATRRFVIRKILRNYVDIHELELYDDNYKSQLLEWCQKNGQTVSYKLIARYKFEKRDRFKVAVMIDGQKVATADDFNKKSAEQTASEKALLALGLKTAGMDEDRDDSDDEDGESDDQD